MNRPGAIELSAAEITQLQRMAAAPDDLESMMEMTDVSRGELLSFMETMGLWEDPEYAHMAGQVLGVLERRGDRHPAEDEIESVDRKPSVRGGWFDSLRQSMQGAIEAFVACVRENILMPAALRRTGPKRARPTNVIAIAFPRRESLPAQINHRAEGIGLILTATAAVVLSTSVLISRVYDPSPGRLITTGAGETTTVRLSDGSVISLGARTALKLAETDQQRVAIVELGEVIFEVPPHARKTLFVQTVLATARPAAGTRFRVTVDSTIEFEVYSGVVNVFPRGANEKSTARTLKQGVPYRVPMNVRGAAMAVRRSDVAARPVDG